MRVAWPDVCDGKLAGWGGMSDATGLVKIAVERRPDYAARCKTPPRPPHPARQRYSQAMVAAASAVISATS